jgi:hypothetical protein
MAPFLQLGNTPAESAEIWHRLPSVYWLLEAAKRETAYTLAEHPSRLDPQGQPLPVVVLQQVGAGKVLFHASDETWRWRYQVGDVFFARYWVQAIRYLSRAKLLGKDRAAELTADRREYRRGENIQLRLRFIDERFMPAGSDGVTVLVERQGHARQQVTLERDPVHRHVFEGQLPRPADGRYHAWVAQPALAGEPAADFTVVAPPGEFERTRMDAAELRAAAQQSKGRFYTIETARRLLDDLPPGRQVPIESLPPQPLWNRWPVLLLLLSLLTAEWTLRKRAGMV